MSVNKVHLVGRTGKDPEVRQLESGKKVASFSLATDDSYKDRDGKKVERTDWHNISFWGPLVEVCEKYLKKGSLIYVEGKLKTRSYEQDGVTKYVTEVLGSQMTMLGGKPEGSPKPTGSQQESDNTDDLPF